MQRGTPSVFRRREWYAAAIMLAIELPLMAFLTVATSQSVHAGGSAYTVSVGTRTDPVFGGRILTDSSGMTLYFNMVDSNAINPGDSVAPSKCYSPCRNVWPPLEPAMYLGPGTSVNTSGYLPEPPTLDPMAKGSLEVTHRLDHMYQIAYNGHPLYRYSGDVKPGDVNGANVDGIWFVAYAGLEPPQPSNTLPIAAQPVPAVP